MTLIVARGEREAVEIKFVNQEISALSPSSSRTWIFLDSRGFTTSLRTMARQYAEFHEDEDGEVRVSRLCSLSQSIK